MAKVTEATGSFLLFALELAPLSWEWFSPGLQRLSGQQDVGRKDEGSDKNIKTKPLLHSGLVKATMRDFNQMGVSAEWRRSRSFGNPKQFIFL